MKTNRSPKLFGSRLIGILALLLFSFVVEGQTYRLLKAGNDDSATADRDEVSTVLSASELSEFKSLKETANVVGYANGTEFNLANAAGACHRAQSKATDFINYGIPWMNANPGLQMVVLNLSEAADLSSLSNICSMLSQTHSVRYLILQTYPDLYPTATPETQESRGLELVTPAISENLNALYDVGIRVFFSAIVSR